MEILFRAPIVRAPGWEFKTGQQTQSLGAGDVIDLNHSGTAETVEHLSQEIRDDLASPLSMVKDHAFGKRGDYKDCGFYQFRYAEPVLSTSLDQLKAVAKDSGPVITEETYPALQVQLGGVNWQGARLYPTNVFTPEEYQPYNALPKATNAMAIHDGFNLIDSPPTSMQALVHKLAPEHPEARWRIDLDASEFLVVLE